jgi:hypothetical protein
MVSPFVFPTPVPTALGAAALLLSPPPPPEVPLGMVGILRPTLVWPTPTGTPEPTATPAVPSELTQSRNVVAVVTNKAGMDVYGQIENYADPERVGGVCLLAGKPVAHLAGGEYVLVINLWGLLAEVRYGEGWQAEGWVSARELCSHPWCQPVR